MVSAEDHGNVMVEDPLKSPRDCTSRSSPRTWERGAVFNSRRLLGPKAPMEQYLLLHPGLHGCCDGRGARLNHERCECSRGERVRMSPGHSW